MTDHDTLGPADLAAVIDVERRNRVRPWSPSSLVDELSGGDRHYVGAWRDGALVGFAGAWFAPEAVHVTTVVVDGSVRRSGVGRGLVTQLLTEALARGVTAATLEVAATNGSARGLYGSLGFIERGRRPGYYAGGEDALILWCDDLRDAVARGPIPTG